jgi:hypothetical protein
MIQYDYKNRGFTGLSDTNTTIDSLDEILNLVISNVSLVFGGFILVHRQS